MHIILVSGRLTSAKSLTLSTRQLLGILGALVMLVLLLSTGLFYLTLRHAAQLKIPYLETVVLAAQAQDSQRSEAYLRENLNAMAVKLGEMQAQLMRLDALGERLAALAGFKPSEFRFGETPGRGGALPSSIPSHSLSVGEFNQQMALLARQMENRNDSLGILESQLFDAKVKKRLMPTIPPVEASWSASSFGWRIDPISGMQAMHEGVDFIAEIGTPIFAAAGGLVTVAESHHQYGLMVEIDHGNDFTTRYAHASRMLVKAGDLVQRGRKIAEVGATGRTTGPHLHFEVRYKGVAQNPARFLQAAR
ncbi:MAG: M23 family peptidase [Betaproteobacteria bacterium]|nr:M23 family peptidase [Betaproteobacteria bacterium]